MSLAARYLREIRARIPLQGSLNVERMCQLAQVSRSGFYRYVRNGSRAEEEMGIRSAIQDVVLDHRWRYGYRRVTAELRERGFLVNHKREARIMQEDSLLVFRHGHASPAEGALRGVQIYQNLAKRMRVSGPNQLWIADLTYIRLKTQFVFLAVMLDAFSRKVIAWALGL